MRLPRDVTGTELARSLASFGHVITRQTGSHMRLTTTAPSQHHVTIPAHSPLKLGTLRAILRDVAIAQEIELEELARRLFGA